MNDQKTNIEQIKQLVDHFVKERCWDQFHDTKSICMDISIEAAELMELFVWAQPGDIERILKEKRTAIEHELADIFFGLLLFCNKHGIDLTDALVKKIEHNAQKYPVSKACGVNKKYNEL